MGRICLQGGRPAFYPWVGKVPWRRAGQPLQYSYLENLHGDSSLAVYSPWGREELDMTEQISTAQVAKKRREAKGKGDKERYTCLNAEFQRRARRDKKVFLSDQ